VKLCSYLLYYFITKKPLYHLQVC